jgi:hypothetical protein
MDTDALSARRLLVLGLTICLAALVLAGCGGNEPAAPDEQVIIRTPRPTFTPTVAPAAAPDTPDTGVPAVPQTNGETGAAPANAPAGAAALASATPPLAPITGRLREGGVFGRRLPDRNSDPLAFLEQGAEFAVIGRDGTGDWWQLCCLEEEVPIWVAEEFIETSGNVGSLPIRTGDEAIAVTPAPEQPTPAPLAAATEVPAAVPAPATATPAPAESAATEAPAEVATVSPGFEFVLVGQEQFPEGNNLVRIFLFVSDADATALPGYTLSVKKDGAVLPVTAVSSDAAGYTWPVANPRQRFQNFKVEFPNMQAPGAWEVQLVDGSGSGKGPAALFTLVAGDTNREFYVRYERP